MRLTRSDTSKRFSCNAASAIWGVPSCVQITSSLAVRILAVSVDSPRNCRVEGTACLTIAQPRHLRIAPARFNIVTRHVRSKQESEADCATAGDTAVETASGDDSFVEVVAVEEDSIALLTAAAASVKEIALDRAQQMQLLKELKHDMAEQRAQLEALARCPVISARAPQAQAAQMPPADEGAVGNAGNSKATQTDAAPPRQQLLGGSDILPALRHSRGTQTAAALAADAALAQQMQALQIDVTPAAPAAAGCSTVAL